MESPDYYKSLLQGLGLRVYNPIISAHACQGDFAVSSVGATVDQYFDILNPNLGNISIANMVTYQARSALIGDLYITNYISASGVGTFESENWIATGNQDTNLQLWKYHARQVAGAVDFNVGNDYTPNQGSVHVFKNIPFQFLRKRVSHPISGTELIEYFFSGLRIDF